MPASPSQNPWPAKTPAVQPHAKRRRINDVQKREIFDWPQVQTAKNTCQFSSGNDVFTCFPDGNTVIPQHESAAIVWNSRQPDFTQTNLVNLYLFHADSLEPVLVAHNRTNPQGDAGYWSTPVDDSWFGDAGRNWNGKNITYQFYWIVQRSDKPLDGTEHTQAVFQAVQTTYADSVLASMSSTASVASASSASAASASSASAASLSRESTATSTSGTPNVQSGGSSSSFPHWAIAVIVVLGFLAIASTCLLVFCILGRVRRRRNESNRNSVGSSSPMMAHAGHSAGSPLLATGAAERHSSVGHHAPSVVSPDGASTISRVGSVGDSGPFSGADAAIMADAFRKALRKPDFAGRPVEEGESPEHQEDKTEDLLLSQQLAEEGRDIRSVSSSRGVKVETLSDSGETAQDH